MALWMIVQILTQYGDWHCKLMCACGRVKVRGDVCLNPYHYTDNLSDVEVM